MARFLQRLLMGVFGIVQTVLPLFCNSGHIREPAAPVYATCRHDCKQAVGFIVFTSNCYLDLAGVS